MTLDAHDDQSGFDEGGPRSRARRTSVYLLIVLVVLLLLVFLPPLINVSGFQRRVDENISAALGRPVHFDRLSLNLLPMPGFTLENFIIEEDPAFGYEPTLHANEVRINLRPSSLWRHRFEFSSISFTDPSVNLVHASDGRWNIQGLLLQASRISAAPTAQAHAGPAPRFPYIEASGARVNLKLGEEKMPISLTDADFALWQPAEHQWRLRIAAHPLRTDTAPGASGTFRVEGTLGGDGDHATLAAMPIDLHATWQDAQLGGVSSLLIGRDAGLRGAFTAGATMLGTIGRNTIAATLSVDDARRADFIPPRALSLSVSCRAKAHNSFHAFASIECRLPSADSSSPAMLALAGTVPDVRRPELASIRLDVPSLPSQTLYDWLGVATPHPPTAFAGRGTLTGALEWDAQAQADAGLGKKAGALAMGWRSSSSGLAGPGWTGELTLSGEWIKLGEKGAPLGDVVLSSSPSSVPATRSGHAAKSASRSAQDSFDLAPVSLPLGGARAATLVGHVDNTGYSMQLSGPVVLDQLFALGDAVPQFGDGLRKTLAPEDAADARDHEVDAVGPPEKDASTSRERGAEPPKPEPPPPIAVDLSVTREWGGAQMWTQGAPGQIPALASKARRRR